MPNLRSGVHRRARYRARHLPVVQDDGPGASGEPGEGGGRAAVARNHLDGAIRPERVSRRESERWTERRTERWARPDPEPLSRSASRRARQRSAARDSAVARQSDDGRDVVAVRVRPVLIRRTASGLAEEFRR